MRGSEGQRRDIGDADGRGWLQRSRRAVLPKDSHAVEQDIHITEVDRAHRSLP